MYSHILIATDGSELADRGMEHGFKLAYALGAKVTVLSVTEPMNSRAVQAALIAGVDDPIGGYDRSTAEDMKERFAAISQRAAEMGVTVEITHECDFSWNRDPVCGVVFIQKGPP